MRTIIQLLIFFLLSIYSFGQSNLDLSGTVRDDNTHRELPAVNIRLMGTSVGTVTDIDGNFNLSVPSGYDTLVFSFVGYKSREISIGTKSSFEILLQLEIQQLSDIIVTAAGIERERQALGYAATKLDGKEIAQKAESDVIRTLSGKVPGVFVTGSNGVPGASTHINIRGNSSFLGNNQPLFVVDGIPFDNSNIQTTIRDNDLDFAAPFPNRLQDVDPNDIETLTVLKGAAAAALYGSRAANGVVVITTKSGKTAATKDGFEVSYAGSFYWERINRSLNYQNNYGQGFNGLYSAPFFHSWGPSFQDLDSVFNRQGKRVDFQSFPDNVSDFFETGHIFENALSIAGGNERTNFIFSGSFLNHDSFIPNSGLDKANVKVAGNVQLLNGLFAGGSFSYIESLQESPTSGFSGFSSRLFVVPRSIDLDPSNFSTAQNEQNFFTCANGRCGDDNPLFSVFESPATFKLNRIFGNTNLVYDVTDWLNLSYRVGIDRYAQKNNLTFAPTSSYENTGAIIVDEYDFKSIESTFLATFNKKITKDFNAKVILGHNLNHIKAERISLKGTGIVVPGNSNINNTLDFIPNGNFLPETQRRLVGAFFDIGLGLKDYLFLNVTGRNDWSSTLPKKNNSFFYPSATLSWILTKALGVKNKWWQYSKLRLAYARVGNDAPPHQLQTVFRSNPSINFYNLEFPFNNISGQSTNDNSGNPELKPEFTNELEVGLETALWNNRVWFDISYYDRTSKDQIFTATVPSSSGFKTRLVNAGELNNKGVEVGLKISPVRLSNGFKWDLTLNFSRNISKVISLHEDLKQLPLLFSFLTPSAVPGYPYGVLVGSAAARDEQGNLLINPINSPIGTPGTPKRAIEEDFYIIGDPNPDFLMGFGSTFSFKGIRINVLLDWKKGGDLFASTLSIARGLGVTASTEQNRNGSFLIPGFLADPEDFSARDQPLLNEEGNKIPNNIYLDAATYYLYSAASVEELSVFDATYLKLRELSISYDFPQDLMKKIFLGSARISLIGRNLWVYTPNMPCCFDPETSEFGSGNAQGIQLEYVPNSKRFGVAINVSF